MRLGRFSRRWFLRGFGGAVISLPLLEVQWNEARANPVSPPRRFAVFFDHGGTLSAVDKTGKRSDGTGDVGNCDGWAPPSPGETLTFSSIQQPVSAYADKILLLRGIDNRAGRLASPLDGDHGWCDATALTCADGFTTSHLENARLAMGPSIDQVLAERLAIRNPVAFPAVRLKVKGVTYGSPFYAAAMQPISARTDPVEAFDALFQGVMESASGAEPAAARARALRKSVLDGTGDMVRVFQQRLGAADRQTVEVHLEHIRALEQRIDALALPMLPGCEKPTLPTSYDTPNAVATAHVDILVAALRCGLTNVAALQIGDLETVWLNPPYVSAAGNGHELGHLSVGVGATGPYASDRTKWQATMILNRAWRMGLFARFLDGLAAIPEGEGTLLDGTLALYTSEFSNAGAHSAADVPVLLAGGSSVPFRMGRHLNFNQKAVADPSTLDYATNASLHNLYTSVLNAFDYPDAHFGNQSAYATGPLSGLS